MDFTGKNRKLIMKSALGERMWVLKHVLQQMIRHLGREIKESP